ncbi:ABC transporter ATP-binding protein [Phytohabitans sp. ZYX-F-186]|uniref:ABC transporter ATP-binding protein n=1 Tax=Phytohabitans maris TaxID=3071409 RepID=A0ABU0ZM52_9ACTN|nr:ABC transporter ATP-binding protein [Phytohabitans sp. ZYX-F-186]MDQ7907487.1 ABC transporter ATP-binding protein [Phytohabitans sp. ZYX-F-186]
MSTPLLEARDLSVSYGRLEPVLRHVSLALRPGEILGLVGMNGAGKTTLMRALSGGLKARSGEVLFQSASIQGRTTATLARAGLVILPEGHRVIRPLTVDENLELSTMSLGRGRVRARLNATRELVYGLFPILRERRHQLAGLLSGGEQQMLSLARAIVQDPKVLLLDEPSLGLAPMVIDRIYESLGSLRDKGISMLIVEQNSQRVAKTCDRLIVLREGVIAAEGSPDMLAGDRLQAAYFG